MSLGGSISSRCDVAVTATIFFFFFFFQFFIYFFSYFTSRKNKMRESERMANKEEVSSNFPTFFYF